MQTRILGRSGHASSVAIFGSYAIGELLQSDADAVIEQVVAAGVNHVDVAPSYAQAEQRLGDWLQRNPAHNFFIGCKTQLRTQVEAAAELRQSLRYLHLDSFDLFQLHAVTSMAELDQVTAHGGALDAIVAARNSGVVRHVGITGHGVDAPRVFLEALRRFDFDTVMFPLNFVQWALPDYRAAAEELLAVCAAANVGVMIIKAVARAPWGERPPTHNTWYEPFGSADVVQCAVDFVLSQNVTGLCTPGDAGLLPLVLRACAQHAPLSVAAAEGLVQTATAHQPLFA